ncbi:hypothetical protein CJO79_03605 [Ralstonia solanacearum]|nr:hypothetical protein CJO76_03615 [Ralstonia solanacearum]AXV90136.1 hypothetical protein CJO79_03605 [Ralstonia solanacearum]AXW18331.1 hypothetical protein CJO85_03650 [Ralstonia solanacearum]AXW75046.1 hypothetical protein CJO97_03615 [Ralstonia solanacearum]
MSEWIGTEAVVPLILRVAAFNNANAVLSDAMALFEGNRALLEALTDGGPERLTVLVLAKEDFRLINASSPITLPDWFPVCPATQTFFSVEDLGQTAEVKPLNCSEARLDHVAELLFDLEVSIVRKLQEVHNAAPNRASNFMSALLMSGADGGDVQTNLDIFVNHLDSISEARAYRPNAADKSKFLGARILKLVLNSSPKRLAVAAEEFGKSFVGSDVYELKPTFFAIMWRPANKTPVGATNWHAILVGFFQCYQLMNAKAHADEFPAYAVALQHATSVNLRRFLASAKSFVSTLS